MRIKIMIFVRITLFFCFVVTSLFGASMVFSSDALIDPQGNETGTNTWYGEGAGSSSTGSNNSFFGFYAGSANTTGHDNSFFGLLAGYNNGSIRIF